MFLALSDPPKFPILLGSKIR
jgi:CubicO group peptidase (beta-lactamase class C family)